MVQPNALVSLRSGGVSVLLDVTEGRLPAIVHWGADLGDLTVDEAVAIVLANVPPVANNNVDKPVRLALLPEHHEGWVGRPGLSGSRAGTGWSPKFAVTAISVDGESLDDSELQFVSTGPGAVEVTAEDPVAQLQLVVTVELAAGGLLRARATVTNTGADGYQVDDVTLAFPVPQEARELLDFAGRWGKERVPQRRELGVGTHLREGRKGRTGADAATLLHLGTPGFGFARGEIWSVHTGWSGNHRHYAERLFSGEQVIGGGELLLPGELILATGESYQTPWIYGSYADGLDAVARRFHAFLRARPNHVDRQRPVTLNVWEAVYFHHDAARLIDLAERAAALGVERYVLDDGWFGSRRNDYSGLGDWTVSKDIWPTGLHPLVDRVRELGMEFGLWFEPEMINVDSDVARAHPEWIMATGDRMPVEARHQQVINLGVPECYAYIRDAIFAVLAEYDIGYIKWDHNRDLIDAGTQPEGRPGVHAQTEAVYRLIDDIKAAHPGLEIESCSSGGARVDLGILERTDRVWVSDCIDPLERQQMNRWTTQLIPPELMGSHIASGRSHTTGRVHDFSFRAATAVFGHLGIEWDLAEATESELADLGDWIAFFKQERDLLLGGDLVRIDSADPTLALHGVVAPDKSKAIYSFGVIARSEVAPIGRFRLPGLDPEMSYRVRPVLVGTMPRLSPPAWWNVTMDRGADLSTVQAPGSVFTGAVLGSVGVQAPALDPDHAVLLRVEALTGD
ncbi:alpha-galactosidase [Microlunatus panaciterrae]